jgi:hypothetical protein
MYVTQVIIILSRLSQGMMHIHSMESVNPFMNLCTHLHSLVHCVMCVPVLFRLFWVSGSFYPRVEYFVLCIIIGWCVSSGCICEVVCSLGKKTIFHKNVCEVNWKLHWLRTAPLQPLKLLQLNVGVWNCVVI